MKTFIAFLFLLFATSAFAEISYSDLSEFNELTSAQKAEIVKNIAQYTEHNASRASAAIEAAKSVDADSVSEWADVGTKYGQMLVGIAKELGIAANEFAKTPVGVFSIGLIVWHVAGEELLGLVLGISWLLVMVPLWTWLFFKVCYRIDSWKEIRVVRWGKEYTVDHPVRGFRRGNGSGTPEGIMFPIALALIVFIGIIFIA